MNNTKSRARLYERRGETSVFIDIEIKDTGEVLMSGQDVGKAPEEYWGDSDYEYWLYVSQDNKDLLLLSLIKKLFGGNSDAFSKFREFLIEYNIPYKFDSWV
jgi:hypothetical protein